ncbi:MAG: hypothetical protein KC422_20475 [Trueperaceae bacterium]|nr:hypothetical protein [Trueperaceae bacterium]
MPNSVQSESTSKIQAIQHLLASIFSSQKALKSLAPEFNWSGLGNLLGDFGELIALEAYALQKAPIGSAGFDALTADGKTVQVKTNYAAKQIGFRGDADLLLVLGIMDNGSWNEIYFGEFKQVKTLARYSARDNKYMIAISKLKLLGQESSMAINLNS